MSTTVLEKYGITQERIEKRLHAASLETPLGYLGIPLSDLLIEYAEKDPRVCYVGVDTMEVPFQKRFPSRAFDVGIAEQNEMGVATGLAKAGMIPVVQAWSPFTPIRNFDQLRTSLARHKSNVKIVTTALGLVNCSHGATHHDMESLALFRVIPNLRILAPFDIAQFVEAFHLAMAYDGPVIIMGPPEIYAPGKEALQDIQLPSDKIAWGNGQTIREGKDVTIVTFGPGVRTASRAAALLREEKIDVGIINLISLKPVDEEILVAAVAKAPVLVTLEEQSIFGGLGSAVAEVIAERGLRVKFKRLGIPDIFVEDVGDWTETRESAGLSESQVAAQIGQLIASR